MPCLAGNIVLDGFRLFLHLPCYSYQNFVLVLYTILRWTYYIILCCELCEGKSSIFSAPFAVGECVRTISAGLLCYFYGYIARALEIFTLVFFNSTLARVVLFLLPLRYSYPTWCSALEWSTSRLSSSMFSIATVLFLPR